MDQSPGAHQQPDVPGCGSSSSSPTGGPGATAPPPSPPSPPSDPPPPPARPRSPARCRSPPPGPPRWAAAWREASDDRPRRPGPLRGQRHPGRSGGPDGRPRVDRPPRHRHRRPRPLPGVLRGRHRPPHRDRAAHDRRAGMAPRRLLGERHLDRPRLREAGLRPGRRGHRHRDVRPRPRRPHRLPRPRHRRPGGDPRPPRRRGRLRRHGHPARSRALGALPGPRRPRGRDHGREPRLGPRPGDQLRGRGRARPRAVRPPARRLDA